jgi:hypothetical protein
MVENVDEQTNLTPTEPSKNNNDISDDDINKIVSEMELELNKNKDDYAKKVAEKIAEKINANTKAKEESFKKEMADMEKRFKDIQDEQTKKYQEQLSEISKKLPDRYSLPKDNTNPYTVKKVDESKDILNDKSLSREEKNELLLRSLGLKR